MKYSKDGIYNNVIMKSAAGYYLGSVTFEEGFYEPYSRESYYYLTEVDVLKDYPTAITLQTAFDMAKSDGFLKEFK